MLEQPSAGQWANLYEGAAGQLASRGLDVAEVKRKVAELEIELPSWGFGRGGTRFGRYPDGTEANDIREKIADCALVHRVTGATPSVATHFPWDGANAGQARETLELIGNQGLRPGAVNSNTFSPRETGALDWRLRYGSLTNPYPEVRRAAAEHHVDCLEIMRLFGSRQLSVWLHDGTNSPGQLSLLEQARWLEAGLAEIYSKLAGGERMLIEYKFFEPAFYATALPDWGTAFSLAQRLGPQALVLVDLGHHAQGTNIEQIVAQLARLGKLGGFHFNDRKYADDDLATGSLDPAQLFRIFNVLVEADEDGIKPLGEVSFVIDQSHNVKNPIEEMIESVDAIQRAYVAALCVDRKRWKQAQMEGDAELGDQLLKNAMSTPAEAILVKMREEKGLPPDPLAALREGGHLEERRRTRKAAIVKTHAGL